MSKTQSETSEKSSISTISEDDRQLLIDLRVNQGKTIQQIADDTGIPRSNVGKILKGVEPAEKPAVDGQRKPPLMAVMIRQEDAAKLYALAIDEGFNSTEDFLEQAMLPWYRVKREFEWKLKVKLEPKKFQMYIESAMNDQARLQQLQEDWAKQLKEKTSILSLPEAAKS